MLFQFSNVLLFVFAGVAFVLGALIVGFFFRPTRRDPEKGSIYECGEPTIGSSWIRYNIRFYTLALVFLIFDVEIVALLPVAVVMRDLGFLALIEMLFFIGVLAIGFVYAWRFRALDWIRSGADRETTVSPALAGGPSDAGPDGVSVPSGGLFLPEDAAAEAVHD